MALTKIHHTCDLCVVGGGLAGLCAAIAAARRGADVLLIEKYNCLGGAAVYDLVNPFMRYWTYSEGRKEKIMLSYMKEQNLI